MDDDSFAGRLRDLIGLQSVRSFAKEVGIGQTTIQKYLAGAMPGLENLVVIAKKRAVTLDWLAMGEGVRAAGVAAADLPEEFRLIPRLDVQPSSGYGALVTSEDAVEMLAFRSDWLKRVGINPDAAHVLTNKGDSNEPTIRDGDILLVDKSIDRVVDNAFYVVVYNGQALLKRVQLMLDGSVVLSSDNKNYQPETVRPADVPSLTIAARLMWFGRSI